MKIVIACDVLGQPNNGTTLAAYNLITFLKQRGHDVTVLCGDQDKKGVEGYCVAPLMNFGPLNLILRANNVTLAKADKKMIAEVLEGADVVHVMIPFNLGSTTAKMAKEAGIPVTAGFHAQAENFTAHVGFMNSRLLNHMTYKWYYRSLYRNVDMIHFPTQFIKDLFEKQVKRSLPGRVISNGVNELFFEPLPERTPNDKFTIFCMGRYSKEKAQQTLIKAIAHSPFRDDVRVCFAGSGPMEKKLKRLASKLHVDAEFHFYKHEDLHVALHNADLYVHTALVEIEAISCLEAIVTGLVPIICQSDRSATKYFAADERCLFKPGDWKDLAEKIAFFYNNPEQLQQYKAKYENLKQQVRQNDCMLAMEQMLMDAAASRHKE